MEDTVALLIIFGSWPFVIFMSVLIIYRAWQYQRRLKNKTLGQLLTPTLIHWFISAYLLGIISTAYMLHVPWYYTILPGFVVITPGIIAFYKTIAKWEKESNEIALYYSNLELLISQKTKELEGVYQKQLEHEKKIQELKDQFVFIAAHELRTPVTSISWWMEMVLEDKSANLTPEVRGYLNNIMASNKKLVDLAEDLLNVARIESKTIQIHNTECDLLVEITETIKELDQQFKANEITVEFNQKEPVKITTDPSRLKQVIVNLLSNAAKYNKPHGSITIAIQTINDFVQIDIKDTGIGIKEEDMHVLFTKFGRIKNDTTAKVEGTGLGLFVTKEIVEKLGGTIWATSIYGEGSTFSVKLPVKSLTQLI